MPFKKGNEIGKGTRFKPGEDWQGNSEGRPVGSTTVKTQLKLLLEELDKKSQVAAGANPDELVPDATRPIAQKLIKMAFGDQYNGEKITFDQTLKALNALMDRMEGKPTQMMGSPEDHPLTFSVKWAGLKDV